MAVYNAKKLTITKDGNTYIIDPLQGNEAVYIDLNVKIRPADWTNGTGDYAGEYVYVFTDNHLTRNSAVFVGFKESMKDSTLEILSYYKETGKITFSTPKLMASDVDLIVRIVDATTDGVYPIDAEMVETDAVVGETNVQGALEDLDDRVGNSVTGPSSATDAHVATFDGTTGKAIKDSGYTIGTSVPANAVFTDTTYSNATQSAAGLMSSTDKTKLDGVAAGATANTGTITGITMNGSSKGTSGVVDLGTVITSHQDISGKVSGPSSATNNAVAIFDGTGGKTIKDSGYTIGKSVPSDAKFTDTTYSNATQSAAGLMSSTDKTKLDGIATGATANTGTITGITMNGASKGTSGVVDLGTVLTSHQDISGKVSGPSSATANAVAIFDGTGGKTIKNSGYTIGKSVPSDAVFTDHTYSCTDKNVTLAWATKSTIATACGTDIHVTMPANPNTNTHRPIQVNGSQILGDNTTALNLKAGSNVTLTNSSGTVTIAATDTNTWRGIQNNLTSTSTTDSLSAYQGKLLNDKIANSSVDITWSNFSNQSSVCRYFGGCVVLTIRGYTTAAIASGGYIGTVPSSKKPLSTTYGILYANSQAIPASIDSSTGRIVIDTALGSAVWIFGEIVWIA